MGLTNAELNLIIVIAAIAIIMVVLISLFLIYDNIKHIDGIPINVI